MKATLESTTAVVTMKDTDGRPFRARVWQGTTEKGVPFTAYVGIVQVRADADGAEFERDLQEHAVPTAATLQAIDFRFVAPDGDEEDDDTFQDYGNEDDEEADHAY